MSLSLRNSIKVKGKPLKHHMHTDMIQEHNDMLKGAQTVIIKHRSIAYSSFLA